MLSRFVLWIKKHPIIFTIIVIIIVITSIYYVVLLIPLIIGFMIIIFRETIKTIKEEDIEKEGIEKDDIMSFIDHNKKIFGIELTKTLLKARKDGELGVNIAELIKIKESLTYSVEVWKILEYIQNEIKK